MCFFVLFSSCCFPILLACRWGWGVGNKGESMFQRMPGWLQLLDGCCLMDGKRGSKPFILHWQSWNTETRLQVRVKKIPVTNSYSWSLPQHFLDIKMHVLASCLFLTNDSEAAFPVIISPALEVSTDVRSINSEIIGMPDAGSFLMWQDTHCISSMPKLHSKMWEERSFCVMAILTVEIQCMLPTGRECWKI